jgi:hypothetical protein
MSITVDATFENGVLRPKQPLDLAEGAEVRVTVDSVAHAEPPESDPLDAVIGICTDGPPDGAENHDAYIYGDIRTRGLR